MERGSRELYRERTGWPLWIHLIVLGATGGAVLGPLLDPSAGTLEPVTRALTAGATLLLVALIHLFLGGLTVVVEPGRIRVGLGRGWPVRTTIPLDEVASLESVEYRPIRDFGGWGVRGPRDRRIWSARGSRAVELTLTDGRVVLIGTDEPRTLENRIRQAMTI